MSFATTLHSTLSNFGYERCGGACYKKIDHGITIYLDNPFSGHDSDAEEESFNLDFYAYAQRTVDKGFNHKGKITVEISTIYKVTDSVGLIKTVEDDLRFAISKILS